MVTAFLQHSVIHKQIKGCIWNVDADAIAMLHERDGAAVNRLRRDVS